jgi:hypothetical protein
LGGGTRGLVGGDASGDLLVGEVLVLDQPAVLDLLAEGLDVDMLADESSAYPSRRKVD